MSAEDIYRPAQREIYAFFNGERDVHCDPLPLRQRLDDIWPELQQDIKGATNELLREHQPKKAAECERKGAEKIRAVFNLRPLVNDIEIPPEGTLTDDECYELLDHFWTWCERLKKNMNPTATSATATLPSSPSLPAGELPTTSTSPSGS